MNNNINIQLEIIEESIKWVNETTSMRGLKGESAYRKLVNYRRKLNSKKSAIEDNPAAAIFGQSQVGKSYLVSNLLTDTEKPFCISDQNGKEFDFIADINPVGSGSESTSLVSRFSVNYIPVNTKYPIKAKLLAPVDLILVLCDSFYNDIKVSRDQMLKSDEIDSAVNEIKNKWSTREIQQNFLTEDNMHEIKDYFNDIFSTKAINISDSFFEEISLLISKIRPNEWKEVFSLLWNRNEEFSELFSNLIEKYESLNFIDTLYLPIEAVLSKHGTLLDVRRLKEIFQDPEKIESEYRGETNLLLIECNKEKEIKSFPKTYLCALSAELIFSLPEDLLHSKPFIKETDLLDFPGSRARKTTPENNILKAQMSEFLIRGKVAYLFNKYSYSEKISIMLFCAQHKQPDERAMPEVLAPLIKRIIGDSPESREEFIKNSKISPLFIISTFFNVNLEYDPLKDKYDSDFYLNFRWSQRFDDSLAAQLIDTRTYSWFNEWTTSKSFFQNIYLLRDFKYSGKIFKGYLSGKKETAKIEDPEQYPNFSEKLRQSFIEYTFVKNHFENPTESWDSAASLNQDGTELIIKKLTIAANNINPARLEKFRIELNSITCDILKLMKEYYNSPDKAESLRRSLRTAGLIQAKLDIAFGRNPFIFGMLMKRLMLNQSDVFNLFIDKIRDIERRDVINTDIYIAIRMKVPELNPDEDFDPNLERLRAAYEFETLQECKDFFEQKIKINLNELFYSKSKRVMNFSQILALSLESYFFNIHFDTARQNIADEISEEDLQNIQNMLKRLFTKLQIKEIISAKIRHYIDGYRNIEEVYEMIADISTEVINKFVCSVGLEFYDESNFNDLEKASENIEGMLLWEHNELKYEKISREEVVELITKLKNVPELLNRPKLPRDEIKMLPNFRNYIIWSDLLKAGFVVANGVPEYDPIANGILGRILEKCQTIKY